MTLKTDIHVFIIGSKGIPARYGGFETFVENLTARKQSSNIKYHVSCMNNDEKTFVHNDAECFNIKLPLKGAFGRILHVSRALKYVERWRQKHINERVVVYILGCRIGPLIHYHYKNLHKLKINVFVNPDGLEWKREKWGWATKRFLKYCEKWLVLNSDRIICDSMNIEKYIQQTYSKMKCKTNYIAYGATPSRSKCSDSVIQEWLSYHKIEKGNYYLIVGRFVPENNFEIILREFMKSISEHDLVIITTKNPKLLKTLEKKLKFRSDERIKFVGTVYDQELLRKIRENAYAYIHGHKVGGTNPSLLEALGSTDLNLLYDIDFNYEVAENAALYWTQEEGSLKCLIDRADALKEDEIREFGKRSKIRITEKYSWEKIVEKYEKIFLEDIV